jgi:inhibitor of KinA
MRVEPLGDQAWILRDLPEKPAIIAKAILRASLPGVTDVVPCLETVGIYGCQALDQANLITLIENAPVLSESPRRHIVPVCYEVGQDLQSVAQTLMLTVNDVIRLHSTAQFECFAIGFCPGFAYLGPLPAELRGIPRMPSPRTRTEPGCVGITGNQTAVYPLPRPGGWPIIGRTPLEMVDESDDYFPIEVGDLVQFRPVSAKEFDQLKGNRL